jgi:hypothetical protein
VVRVVSVISQSQSIGGGARRWEVYLTSYFRFREWMLFERKGRNASGTKKKPRLPELELKLNIEATPRDKVQH